jgi:phosphatidate cytidylyltransferase
MRPLSQNFKQRLIFSLLFIPALIAAVYFSNHSYFQPFFAFMTAGLISMALWEFYQLTIANGYNPQIFAGIACTFAYIFALYLNYIKPLHNALPEAILGLTLIFSFSYFFKKGSSPFINLAITFFGIFYLTIPLGCLFSINFFFSFDSIQDGRWWLFYVLAVTKMTDIGAYFTGKIFGRTQLAAYISPKKTLEGAIGGVIAGLLTSLFFSGGLRVFFNPPPVELTLIQSIGIGGITSLLAQFGDLSESLLKRDMGIKDSNQLPGLGGVLDILDSLVFTAPFIYIFLKTSYL